MVISRRGRAVLLVYNYILLLLIVTVVIIMKIIVESLLHAHVCCAYLDADLLTLLIVAPECHILLLLSFCRSS